MIPFSPPRIDQRIIDEVTDTLRSGWITTGPKTKRFEVELQKYTQCKRVLCLNSATAGLEIMLRWYGVGEGDEVILPAYTYSATANVIMHCGATPVFVDVNEDDFNISVQRIEAAITVNTKVIMPVDFGGLPCDYAAINALAEKHRGLFKVANNIQEQLGRILVLSDAAHSIGAWYQGKRAGALTDVSVISFHAVKNLTTAEGGAICLNLSGFDNDKIYQDLCVKTLHGQNKDALAKMVPGNWKYDIVEAGYKFNMTDILSSIGLVELSRYDTETLPVRKAICDQYQKGLQEYSWAKLPIFETPDKVSSYHLYPLRINQCTEMQRDEIITSISSLGVSVNVHFIPVPMMSFYKKLGFKIDDYPVTKSNYEVEISLPVFFDLNEAQVQEVISAVVESVNKVLA